MIWQEALEALKDHPHVWRYRQLCADNNPNDRQREKYRDVVILKAQGEIPPPRPDINTGIGWVPPLSGCGGC